MRSRKRSGVARLIAAIARKAGLRVGKASVMRKRGGKRPGKVKRSIWVKERAWRESLDKSVSELNAKERAERQALEDQGMDIPPWLGG